MATLEWSGYGEYLLILVTIIVFAEFKAVTVDIC